MKPRSLFGREEGDEVGRTLPGGDEPGTRAGGIQQRNPHRRADEGSGRRSRPSRLLTAEEAARNMHRESIFWLADQPTGRAFSAPVGQWQLAAFVPAYSDGFAPDFHRTSRSLSACFMSREIETKPSRVVNPSGGRREMPTRERDIPLESSRRKLSNSKRRYRSETRSGFASRCGVTLKFSSEMRFSEKTNSVTEVFLTRQFISMAE